MKNVTPLTVIISLGMFVPINLEAEPTPPAKETQIPQKNFSSEPITVTVFGAVTRPGIYEVPDWSTLLEAIAIARGFNEFAETRRVTVMRTTDGKTELVNVNLREALSKGQLPMRLKHRDRIIVAHRSSLPPHVNREKSGE